MTTSICRGFLTLYTVGALVLTGCSQLLAQSEAVSQPSTEAQSPAYTSEPISKFDVPEYTTDLDLTAEEKLAAEEALIGLQRYIFVSEQVMKSGGEDTLHIDSVSVGSAKEGLDKTASNFRKRKKKFLGHIVSQDFHIHEVDIAKENRNELSISACLPADKWGVRGASDKSSDQKLRDEARMIWTLEKESSTWKVAVQELYSEDC